MIENNEYMIAPGAALTANEREYIKSLAQQSESNLAGIAYPLFVGIGVMWAGSFHCMRAGSENAVIYGLDIDYTTHSIHKSELIAAKKWIQADSRTFDWYKENENKIDFLFIDGDHTYETVKADILNWRYNVAIDGVIAFHDYKPSDYDLKLMPHLDGVRKAVEELMRIRDFIEVGRADSIIAFRRII